MNAAVGRLQPRGSVELSEYPVDMVWMGDGRALLVGLADGAIVRLEPERGLQPQRVPAHAGSVLALAAQKSGQLFVSCGEDGAVLLWDARTLQSRRLLQGSQWSERLAFSDSGQWLAVATGRTLALFDGEGTQRYQHAAPAGTILALAWRPKSMQVAAAGNGGVLLHGIAPTARGAAQAAARGVAQDVSVTAPAPASVSVSALPLRSACLSAAFSPDGRWLAAGLQEGAVQLWNLASGGASQMSGYGARVFATEWSANSRYLATAAGSTLAIWDCAGRGPEGSKPLNYPAHSERITALAFRPSGTWLATAARDRRLLWWRVGAGDTPLDAHLLAEECSVLRFSRDGAHLAVADTAGRLTIYACRS